MAGWSYPQHLAGRAYGVLVHGDVAGIEGTRRFLCHWLDWMGLLDAGVMARLDRDEDLQEETRNVARAVAQAVVELRAGRLQTAQPHLKRPRPK